MKNNWIEEFDKKFFWLSGNQKTVAKDEKDQAKADILDEIYKKSCCEVKQFISDTIKKEKISLLKELLAETSKGNFRRVVNNKISELK